MASNREQFLSTFIRRQNFVFPDSMIYYILKNPSSAKVYQKVIQSCKYFFIKNPILVIHCLQIDDEGWKICSNQGNCENSDIRRTANSRIISKCRNLWVEHQIRIYSTDSKAASDLIPKIYKCDTTHSCFSHQNMSLHQFLFYARNSEDCFLDEVIISSDIGTEIQIEEIVANLPNVLKINIMFCPDSRNVSSDTVKKLIKIPHFQNITKFNFWGVPEKFDIDVIYDYYKCNRSQFTFGVEYQNELSEDFARKLDGIVDEILDYKFYDNYAPFIGYPKQSYHDYNALNNLNEKFLR